MTSEHDHSMKNLSCNEGGRFRDLVEVEDVDDLLDEIESLRTKLLNELLRIFDKKGNRKDPSLA